MGEKTTTILVIEDEPSLRESMVEYLEDRDFRVLAAENGRVGLEVVERDHPDLVLTDLRMPEVDGLEVLKRARELSSETPLIVVSGTGRIGDSVQALRLGAWDYILKPIDDMSIISHAVDRALERARLLRENREYQEGLERKVSERTKELERSNERLTAINERLHKIVASTGRLTACKEVRRFGPELLKEFAGNMLASGGSMYLVEDDGLRLLHAMDPGHAPEFIPFPLSDSSIIDRTMKEKKALLIPEITSEPDFVSSGWSGYHDGSALVFPLPNDKGDIVGVITLHSKTSPPFVEQDKEIGAILASFSCETLRAVRATESLQEISERMELVLWAAELGTWDWNVQTGDVTFNERWAEIHGRRLEEIEPYRIAWEKLVHPGDVPGVEESLNEHLEGTTDFYEIEYRLRHKSGKWIWVLDRGKVIERDVDGKPLRACGMNLDITERKRAEEAIRESEEKYRALFERESDAIFIFDPDTTSIIDANEATVRMYGYDRDELIGMSCLEFSAEVEKSTSAIDRIRETGEVYVPERYHKRSDGTVFPVDVSGYKIALGGKEVTFAVSKDITDRIQAEEKLKGSERQSRAWLENSPVCTKVVDLDFNLQFMSAAGIEGLRIDDVTQLYGKPYPFDFYPDSFRNTMKKNLEEAKETGETITQEASVVDIEGNELWYHSTLVPVNDDEGRLDYMMVLSVETTERNQAEKALRESEEKHRRLFEHSNDPIFVHALSGKILDVNNRACEMLSYSREQLLSMSLQNLHPKEEWDRCAEAVRATEQEDSTTFESQFITADGSILKVSISSKIVDLESGTVQGIVRDITETKRLQDLEFRAERLEMAGTIAGQVAHDLNNLLAPIMAYPELIHDELPDGNLAHEYLNTIEEAAESIAEINQDLLTMGRRGHYNQAVIDLNQVVSRTIQEIQSRTPTVTVGLNLGDDLMKVKGGNAQLHRVLTNLLVNAQDAIQGTGQITIKTENYYADDTTLAFNRVPKGEYVKLTITDSGCGIPDDIIQHVLDPFFSTKRADTRRGSGLGLSIVDGVIKDHNGYLDLESKVGHGTSFYIYLPAAREDVEADKAEQLLGGKEKVLVVDDDATQREVSLTLLTKLGYTVNSVESGEKAIEFLRKNPQDLVLLDMVMPGGMDGADTYGRIIEISPHQKAIILSGYSGSDRVFEAQKLGAGAFVRKPVTIASLSLAIRKELDREIELVP